MFREVWRRIKRFCIRNNPWWMVESIKLCWRHSAKSPGWRRALSFADWYWYYLKWGWSW